MLVQYSMYAHTVRARVLEHTVITDRHDTNTCTFITIRGYAIGPCMHAHLPWDEHGSYSRFDIHTYENRMIHAMVVCCDTWRSQ